MLTLALLWITAGASGEMQLDLSDANQQSIVIRYDQKSVRHLCPMLSTLMELGFQNMESLPRNRLRLRKFPGHAGAPLPDLFEGPAKEQFALVEWNLKHAGTFRFFDHGTVVDKPIALPLQTPLPEEFKHFSSIYLQGQLSFGLPTTTSADIAFVAALVNQLRDLGYYVQFDCSGIAGAELSGAIHWQEYHF